MKRKKHKAKKKFPIFLFLKIGLFFVLIYFFFFSNFFAIKKIQADELIYEIVEKNIIRKIGFLELNNIFLINKSKTSKEIDQIIKIESFSIKRKLPNTVIVNIKKRESKFVCCLENNCFHVDKRGIAFEKAERKDYIVCPLLKIGDQAMREKDVLTILEVQKELKDYSGKLFFDNDFLTLETKEGWHVFFNLKDNISDQIFRLRIILTEMVQNTKDLDYVDLRYGEKIYFK